MSEENTKPIRLLIADDEKDLVVFLAHRLRKRGIDVTMAVSGAEAVSAATELTFDVAIVDLRMPDMDGIETTRRIRQSEGGSRSIPIIALTANAMYGDRKKYLDAGMDGYVSKPISATELFHTIDKALTSAEAIAS